LNRWALELGGHVRTGLEDNLRYDRTRLASSNAELVGLAADLCDTYGRRPATPAEAREILSLAAA
ncbi:MAG: 3-keto-5-aminohexanoate cleavage protein, partial [Alphaproteobacteria bacterium]